MKGFLFDENVPRNIAFKPSLPIQHVTNLGSCWSDTAIWKLSKENSWVILTKDSDFSNRIMLSTPPPWVIHLHFGNIRRKEYHKLLAALWPRIESLLPSNKLLNVFPDRIEAIQG